jgi:hypothetical protein
MEFNSSVNRKQPSFFQPSKTDFIRYLYQEGVRHGKQNHPDFYKEIILFINTPQGIDTFEKFKAIDPSKLGVNIKHIDFNLNR